MQIEKIILADWRCEIALHLGADHHVMRRHQMLGDVRFIGLNFPRLFSQVRDKCLPLLRMHPE